MTPLLLASISGIIKRPEYPALLTLTYKSITDLNNQDVGKCFLHVYKLPYLPIHTQDIKHSVTVQTTSSVVTFPTQLHQSTLSSTGTCHVYPPHNTGNWPAKLVGHQTSTRSRRQGACRRMRSSKEPDLLREPGITLLQGESRNLGDILTAVQGCQGAFLNTVPSPCPEALQAKTVVLACQRAGVENMFAATTFYTGNNDMWNDNETKEIQLHGYFSSKAEVEDIVRAVPMDSRPIPSFDLQSFITIWAMDFAE